MTKVTNLMLFMVCLAAAAGAMGASGLTDEVGAAPDPGISEEVNQSEEEFKTYTASRDEGATSFIGAVISGVDKTIDGFKLIFALYPMLVNLGLPEWVAAFISAPLYFLFGLFILYLLTGRQTSQRL